MKFILLLYLTLIIVSCNEAGNKCTITIHESLEEMKPNILIYKTSYCDTQKVLLRDNINTYNLDFGDLGKNDGIINFQIKKDSTILCLSNLYFTNGFIIGNNYIIKKDSNLNCSIQLAN
jgi:hypothetical protein